jgi:hypothetical protein
MPQIFTAFASEVKVNEETVEGLQSIEYNVVKNIQNVRAIGSDERIGVVFGLKTVVGKLRVASISAALDRLLQSNASFSVSATLRNGDATRRLAFDECYMDDKAFGLSAEGRGETIYAFSATRLREE